MIADIVLVLHFCIAAFITLGLLAIWLGAALGWRWVRNPWLRGGTRSESFVGRWVRQLLFYEAPEWVFTTAYVLWTAATLVTLRLVPPTRRAG